ncbi:MAG: LuxR C-terminal-related transcriptional regulator, partial [Cytophagales bacterium]|nr:LuxR C-terminal-related transcriptional regulator [Cytophagales bacterium]
MSTSKGIFDSVYNFTQRFIGSVREAPEIGSFDPDMEYKLLDQFYENAPTAILIYNHLTLNYNYFSPNIKQILGHDGKDFMAGGLKFAMSLVHEEDQKTYSSQIIPTMFRYIGIFMLKRQVKDLKFTFSFRLKHKNGSYMWILHQMSVVKTSIIGIPSLTQVNISDITSIKKDDSIDFAIHKKSENGDYDILYNKLYYPDESTISFSGRELDVLKLLAQGKTSNQIADELNISFHTVNNHRKKMIERNKG